MGSKGSDSMTNNTPSDDRGDADSEAFKQWLNQAAESKGVSRQEMMNQMLSSYWILDELSGLVGEAEGLERGGGPHTSAPVESPIESEDATPATEPEASVGSDNADSSEDTDREPTEDAILEIRAAIQELVESQSEGSQESAESSGAVPPSSLDGGVVGVVSDLQRQVGKFESKLDEVETKQDQQFERLSGELQLALDRVSEVERSQDRFARKESIEDLSNEIEGLSAELETLRTADEELEAQMEQEFDSVETLFRRVLDAIDELDGKVDSTTESYRGELEPIQQRQAKQERLEELKSDALQRDIRHGTCESCGQGVDLGLLESPTCPKCSSEFTGIGTKSWNPFRSPTIETESPPIN